MLSETPVLYPEFKVQELGGKKKLLESPTTILVKRVGKISACGAGEDGGLFGDGATPTKFDVLKDDCG